MAYIPFITTIVDYAPEPESNVCGLPPLTLALQRVRRLRRHLETCERSIANDDPNSADITEAVRAGMSEHMLPLWQSDLKAAETALAMLQAGDTMTYRGRAYRAVPHSAGAN